jgi:hypothetical protein
VKNTKRSFPYLEDADGQNDAKQKHEGLGAEYGEVGDLDTCKEKKRAMIEQKLTSIYKRLVYTRPVHVGASVITFKLF